MYLYKLGLHIGIKWYLKKSLFQCPARQTTLSITRDEYKKVERKGNQRAGSKIRTRDIPVH